MNVVPIHKPPATYRRILAMVCPCCKRRTRLIGFCRGLAEWHDTCLRCGRSWVDGEWTELPFIRGARQQSIAEAKRRWRETQGEVYRHSVGVV